MKQPICLILFAAAFACLAGCQIYSNPAPLISAETAKHAGQSDAVLREGRALFVTRCIECHALPVVTHHRAEIWPHLVDKMAARADLKPAEREALAAYLVTLRHTLP